MSRFDLIFTLVFIFLISDVPVWFHFYTSFLNLFIFQMSRFDLIFTLVFIFLISDVPVWFHFYTSFHIFNFRRPVHPGQDTAERGHPTGTPQDLIPVLFTLDKIQQSVGIQLQHLKIWSPFCLRMSSMLPQDVIRFAAKCD